MRNKKKVTVRTFQRREAAPLTANLFDRVRAATARPVYVVGDCCPGIEEPVAHVATGRGFTATFRHEREARCAAFVAMAEAVR